MKRVCTSVLAPLAAAGLSLSLAACGGGSSSKASSTATSTLASVQGYINCLKSHGYTPPAGLIQRLTSPPTTDANGDGGGFFFGGGGGGEGGGGAAGDGAGASGTPRTTLDPAQAQARQQAFSACQSQAPAGFRLGGGGRGGQAFTALRAYISCLNDHGYTKITVPTTVQGGTPAGGAAGASGPGVGPGGGLRQQLQAVQSDPSAAAAVAACKPLLPTFPDRLDTTTTTTAAA